MPVENPQPRPDAGRERQQPAPRPRTFPESTSEYGQAHTEREELRANEPPPGSDDYVRHKEQDDALTKRVRTLRGEGAKILATYLMAQLQRVDRTADYALFLNDIKHACERALRAREQTSAPPTAEPGTVTHEAREGTQATLEGGASGT